ncbi:MAG: hypothetical protein WC384_13170 [Prolixibacteraceae bacterium]
MKFAVILVRVLMGLKFAFASIVVLFNLVPHPEMTGDIKTFNDGLEASKYMITTIKLFELVCAVSFLSGRFVSLATVIIFPITLNILLYHSFLDPQGLSVAVPLMIGNLFLAYYYRDRYKPFLAIK